MGVVHEIMTDFFPRGKWNTEEKGVSPRIYVYKGNKIRLGD